jgi:hypothetical protein
MPTTITPNLPLAGSTNIAAVFRPPDEDLSAGTPVLRAIGEGAWFFAPPFFFVAIASPNLPLRMISKSISMLDQAR